MSFFQGGGLGQFNQGLGAYQSQSVGTITLGNQFNQGQALSHNQLLQYMQAQEPKHMSGDKPIVVCAGASREAKDMDDAQQIAESMAHSSSANAYILKPVKKVAPKRDVVTTDLA